MTDSVREITPAELANHSTRDSCWIVIHNHVYDVTKFIALHPGGADKLFPDLAGADGTAAFDAVGHSDEARELLDDLLVGRVAGPVPKTAPQKPKKVLRDNLYQGVNHRIAKDGEDLWNPRCRGFLPARDPLKDLPAPYSHLVYLASQIPAALAQDGFRALVERSVGLFGELERALPSEERTIVLERLLQLYSYVGKAYVHNHAEEDGLYRVPAFLGRGWLAVAAKLGREPTIDYAGCVLYNWERIDPEAGITPENIRMLCRFTGLLDEEWFLKTHVMIESEASTVVWAIHYCKNAVKNADKRQLLSGLDWFEQGMNHVATHCLRLMFETKKDDSDCCSPHMFFHRFRHYICTWTAIFEDQFDDSEELRELRSQLAVVETLAASGTMPSLDPHKEFLEKSIRAMQKRVKLNGPSGAMSTLLPCCDALLSVGMSHETLANLLQEFQKYMPQKHRELLYSVRRNPLRPFILKLVQEGDPDGNTLAKHFNACVKSVLDFRWRHLNYIHQYIVGPSGGDVRTKGTGGTPALTYLTQHITDTEDALIDINDDVPSALQEPAGPALRLTSEEGLWSVNSETGLLPRSAPVLWDETCPAGWETALELGRLLVSTCVPPASFRDMVEERVDRLVLNCSLSEEDAERGRSLLAHILAGWRASPRAVDVDASLIRDPLLAFDEEEAAALVLAQPPSCLAEPFSTLSERLDRAPRLGLTDTMLYNWRSLSPTSEANLPEGQPPPQETASKAPVCVGTVLPLQRFLGIQEENWYLQLHVSLASQMGRVVKSMGKYVYRQLAPDLEGKTKALFSLTHAVDNLVRIHYEQGVGKPSAGRTECPQFLLRRLHRFLEPARDFEASFRALLALEVYSAMGIAQSCLLSFLGIRGDTIFHRYREWREGENGDLPCGHRDYVAQLRSWPGVRQQLLEHVGCNDFGIQEISQVELAYNGCVTTVLQLFNCRWDLVRLMCPEGAAQLDSEFQRERDFLYRSRMRLLMDRHEASLAVQQK